MTASEKAVELVNMFYCKIIDTVTLNEAKEFALMVVSEIIKEIEDIDFNNNLECHPFTYWDNVKQEIEKLN